MFVMIEYMTYRLPRGAMTLEQQSGFLAEVMEDTSNAPEKV